MRELKLRWIAECSGCSINVKWICCISCEICEQKYYCIIILYFLYPMFGFGQVSSNLIFSRILDPGLLNDCLLKYNNEIIEMKMFPFDKINLFLLLHVCSESKLLNRYFSNQVKLLTKKLLIKKIKMHWFSQKYNIAVVFCQVRNTLKVLT